MNEKEAKEIIDNMSEQELNNFIFFALQEVEKENQKLKTKLEKKDKIIYEMAKKLSKFDYSQYCEVTNCNYPPCNKEKCIKQYYERKVENGN